MSILTEIKVGAAKVRAALASVIHTIQAAALTTYITIPSDVRSALSPKALGAIAGVLMGLGFLVNWMDIKAKTKAVTAALFSPVPPDAEKPS